MKIILSIARREFFSHFNTFRGYILIALVLFITGLLFNTLSLGKDAKLSYDILAGTGPRFFGFFWVIFGTSLIASLFISMGSINEEKKTGTLDLFYASGVKEYQIVLGKWLSSLSFLSVLLVISLYLPALIFVNGKVSISHISVGYLGLFLSLSMSTSIGIFASSISKTQAMAAILTGVILAFFLLSWVIAKNVDAPFREFFSYLSMFDRHFGRSFAKGILSTQSIIYYVSMTSFFLLLTKTVLESRRWK